MVNGSTDSCGVVFAATGETYITLARRSARTLRRVMPGLSVDLFTDQPIDDPVFDRIHILENNWIRPKMEALRRSRFGRSLFLDADTIVLCDVSDLFGLLDTYDFAGCQALGRPLVLQSEQGDIPGGYPYLNSGVLLVRRTPETDRLLADWEIMTRTELAADRRESHLPKDQFALRRLLYESGLRVLVLPAEYNFMYLPFLDVWADRFGLPKILHLPQLHRQDPGNPQDAFDAAAILGPDRAAVLAGPETASAPHTAPAGPPRRRGWLKRLTGA